MKPTGPLLLLLLTCPAWILAAESPPAKPPVRFSAHMNDAIRGRLPKFIPKPASVPTPEAAPAVPAPAPDPEVLVLPKVVVKEWRPPTNDPDVWLTQRSIQQKAMAAYQGSLTGLEWALNSWYIPLFGTPPSARGRAYYQSSKYGAELERLDHLTRVISQTDPAAAAQMKRAMDH